MKDLYNNIVPEVVMAPVTVNDPTSDEDIDLEGYNSCLIMAVTGAGAIDDTDFMSFRISHADDNGTGSADSYSYVEDDDLLGAGTVTEGIPATPLIDDEDAVYCVGYVGGKRFLKIELIDDAETNGIIGLYVIKGHPLDVPEIS
jgi:hypothetical protein